MTDCLNELYPFPIVIEVGKLCRCFVVSLTCISSVLLLFNLGMFALAQTVISLILIMYDCFQ